MFEQNLSEQERKQRLLMGGVLLTLSAVTYVLTSNPYLGGGLALAGLGFFLNYITCFCGTKKMLSRLK